MSERTWMERLLDDPELQAFVRGEIARAGIDVAAAQAEAAHWRCAAEALNKQLREARRGQPPRERKGTTGSLWGRVSA